MRPARNITKAAAAGFTLIELMVVILLVAMMAAIAMPRLMPLLVLTTHEGGARQLVGFGRSAMAHAALTHQDVILKIDLDNQEYWAEAQPDSEDTLEGEALREEEDEEREKEDDEIPDDKRELVELSKRIIKDRHPDEDEELTPEEEAELEAQESEWAVPNDEAEQNEVLDQQREDMMERFAKLAEKVLVTRASRIEHDEDYDLLLDVDEDNPYYDIEDEEDEATDRFGDTMMPQEITTSLLRRTKLDSSLKLESVVLGEVEYLEGIVEVILTPLGLDTPVLFRLANDEGDVYSIHWDPITGGAWYEMDWGES